MAVNALLTALLIGVTCADLRTQSVSNNAPGSSLSTFSGGNIGISLDSSSTDHIASSGINNGQVGFSSGSPRKLNDDSTKQFSTRNNGGFKDGSFSLNNAGSGRVFSSQLVDTSPVSSGFSNGQLSGTSPVSSGFSNGQLSGTSPVSSGFSNGQLSGTSPVSSGFSNGGSAARFGGSSGVLSGIHGASIGNSAVRSHNVVSSGNARFLNGFSTKSNGVSSGVGGGIISGKPFFAGSLGSQRPVSAGGISGDLSAIINGVSGGFSSNGIAGSSHGSFPQQSSLGSFSLRGSTGLTGSGVSSNNVVPFSQSTISHQSDVGVAGASGAGFTSASHDVSGTAGFPNRVFLIGGDQSQSTAALGQSASFNKQSPVASGHANSRGGIASGPASSGSNANNGSNGQGRQAQIINSIGGRVNIPGITDGFHQI